MRRSPALVAWFAVASAAVVLAATEPATAPVKRVVTYQNDRVTVVLDKAPVGEVLQDIAKQSGAEIVGAPRAPREVSMTFEAVPMKEALERLVGAQNFTLKYDDAGKLRSIELRGEQEELRRPAEQPLGGDDSGRRTKEYAFWKAFDRREPVALTGDVARLFQRDEMMLGDLGTATLIGKHPRVRRGAVRAIVEAVERDAELREQVLAAIGAMSDEELAAFARARAYHLAEDLMRNVLREAPDGELRTRARNVLRELKKNPFTGTPPEMH